MTGKQSAVFWLGLLLITVRLFTTNQWKELWSVVGQKAAPTLTSGTAADVPGGPLNPLPSSAVGTA
jgi:hypothetical protein